MTYPPCHEVIFYVQLVCNTMSHPDMSLTYACVVCTIYFVHSTGYMLTPLPLCFIQISYLNELHCVHTAISTTLQPSYSYTILLLLFLWCLTWT